MSKTLVTPKALGHGANRENFVAIAQRFSSQVRGAETGAPRLARTGGEACAVIV